MNKRNTITYLIIGAIAIVAISTNTIWYLIIAEYFLILLNYLLKLNNVNKCYNMLEQDEEEIKKLEKIKYKTYFKYSGKALEEKINFYDECIRKHKERYKILINILKVDKKYLSKSKREKVLQLENEV